MRSKLFRLMWLTLPLAACESVPSAAPAPAAPAAREAMGARGLALAESACSGCHAIGRYGSSSSLNAPPFHAIANQDGLTEETLSYWLSGAHNYPSEMDFYLTERQVDELVAYMLTLRDPNYRRPPD